MNVYGQADEEEVDMMSLNFLLVTARLKPPVNASTNADMFRWSHPCLSLEELKCLDSKTRSGVQDSSKPPKIVTETTINIFFSTHFC